MAETAESLNMTCFSVARAAEGLDFSVQEARPLAKVLLRAVGRILIDTAGPNADPEVWGNTEEMVLQWLNEAVAPLGYRLQPAPGSDRPQLVDPDAGWAEA